MSPSMVDEKPASGIDPVEYPIYCLTDLTTAEKKLPGSDQDQHRRRLALP